MPLPPTTLTLMASSMFMMESSLSLLEVFRKPNPSTKRSRGMKVARIGKAVAVTVETAKEAVVDINSKIRRTRVSTKVATRNLVVVVTTTIKMVNKTIMRMNTTSMTREVTKGNISQNSKAKNSTSQGRRVVEDLKQLVVLARQAKEELKIKSLTRSIMRNARVGKAQIPSPRRVLVPHLVLKLE